MDEHPQMRTSTKMDEYTWTSTDVWTSTHGRVQMDEYTDGRVQVDEHTELDKSRISLKGQQGEGRR